jgi:hypothetical protein
MPSAPVHLGIRARTLCFVFGVCVVLLTPARTRAADPFETLNEAFRKQHAEAREREWSRRGPVILVEFEKLTLFAGDERKSANVLPVRYDRLKSIAHTPFAIYLALEGSVDKPLDDRQRSNLKEIASRIEAVRNVLATADFTPDEVDRQREILDRCTRFISDTLKFATVSTKALTAFAGEMRPLMMKNSDEAAELQIRGYDRQVAEWQHEFPALDWKSLKVVISGSALPRKQNLATQYFARLLGVRGEGPRLVYAESLYDEAKALRLLKATAVDAKAGSTFFDDPSRLHRDLLADATEKFLREHGSELKAAVCPAQP